MSEPTIGWWQGGLSHKDWLFDGYPIRGPVMMARFANLDWERAWVDVGPSVAGNPGPYWHVPLKGPTFVDEEEYDFGDTTHRLYPKLLTTKWLPVVQQAMTEVRKRAEMATRGMAEVERKK